MPDWVIEVFSPSTKEKDAHLKRDLYERNGVRLYWMVSPGEHSLTVLRLGPANRYLPPEKLTVHGRLAVAEYPGLQIDWDRVFRE